MKNSLVKYEVLTVQRKVAFHDLHVPWAIWDFKKYKNYVEETIWTSLISLI
jgi:hypothetical protein